MNLITLPPEERKRMLAILQQDAEYAKSRNTLLAVSVLCSVSLAAFGMMLMNDFMTMWMSITLIGSCVVVYLFFLVRVVSTRKAALTRMMLSQLEKKAKKKARAGKGK